MADSLNIPPLLLPGKRNPETQRRVSGRQSHASYASWISSLANPDAEPTTPPPPVPTINIDLHSPASTVRTVRLASVPISRVASPFDPDMESQQSTSTHDEKEITHIKYGMTTVEEVSEQPASPVTRVGRARSLVDGLVSGLRNLPRAVTHSQLYDRMSIGRESSRTSHFTDNRATVTDFSHDGEMSLKFPPGPFPIGPFVLAPPFGMPPMMPGSAPMSVSHAETSKLGSEADTETRAGRIGSLLAEIQRMPWISPRVAVDYIPGERRSTSPSTKVSSSWYTITAPSTPSDISNPWQTLPEPWFPPTELPTMAEEPEAEEQEAEDDKENAEERLREIREELQEKARQLGDLRQVVEHQKMHISALEGELAEVQKADEADLHRRRSSVRGQSLRARDSLRVSRHTSVRVSRPSSSFFD